MKARHIYIYIYIYTRFSRDHPPKIVALRSVYYFTASKISRDVFCDSFKWHLGKEANRALQISEKKKRKEKENQSTYIVYLQKERNDWKLFITRSIRCPSKASRNHPLSFPFLFPINNATNRDEFRISFFKIKQGADDAVQDHPKKTRFGRTCSRRKTADRNQTLPLSLPHVHVTNSLSSVYIRSFSFFLDNSLFINQLIFTFTNFYFSFSSFIRISQVSSYKNYCPPPVRQKLILLPLKGLLLYF